MVPRWGLQAETPWRWHSDCRCDSQDLNYGGNPSFPLASTFAVLGLVLYFVLVALPAEPTEGPDTTDAAEAPDTTDAAEVQDTTETAELTGGPPS